MHNPETQKRMVTEGGVVIPTLDWDFPQYKTPRDYLGQEVKVGIQKATKKGFYMDYLLKTSKEIPSSQHYKTSDSWSVPKKPSQKIDLKIRKMTYIDDIELEFKRKKATPSVGIYKLLPSKKEIEERNNKLRIMSSKLSQPPKRYFYEDTELLSSTIPGPGNYNPHEIRSKSLMNRTQPKFWIKKHSDELKVSIKRNKVKPDPALYRPSLYGTFDRFKQVNSGTRTAKSAKSWGSSSRFTHYQKSPFKNPNQQKRPQAATYNLTLKWKGKPSDKTKADEKKRDWYHSLSRPQTSNIYH